MALSKKEYSALDAAPVVLYTLHSPSEDKAYPILSDPNSGRLCTIDYAHCEIHEGGAFTCSKTQDTTNGANFDFILITPNSSLQLHFTYEIDVEGESDFTIYEDAVTGTGTTLAIFNRNRNSATTSSAIVQTNPVTVTTGTTLLRQFHVGSNQQFGGGDRPTHEIILKQNTKYLIRLMNATALNNYMAVKLDWYEHSPLG